MKSDTNDEDDKDGTAASSKEEEDSVEMEEQEFTRWFGSLKDEENVQPKEEAIQVLQFVRLVCAAVTVRVSGTVCPNVYINAFSLLIHLCVEDAMIPVTLLVRGTHP